MRGPMNAPELGAEATPAPSTSAGAPDDRATTFRAVQGGGETVAGGKLLIAAYAIVWVIVLLVVVRIFRRQNGVARELGELEGAIRRAQKQGGKEPGS